MSFLENPTIKTLAEIPRWTISTPDKIPAHFAWLVMERRFRGANIQDDPSSAASLDQLLYEFPDAKNLTFYIKSQIDKFIAVDIESTCPKEIAETFLDMPFLYGERSLSGKGYHLIFPRPEWLDKDDTFEPVRYKTVVKQEKKYFEYLFEHWVLFTGNQIDPPANPKHDLDSVLKPMMEDELQKLDKKTKNGLSGSISLEQPENIPKFDKLVSLLKGQTFSKKLDQYGDDYSRYTFAVIGFYKHLLNSVLKTQTAKSWGHDYTLNERTWIIYEVVSDILPHREKYDRQSLVNGQYMPFLQAEIVRNLMM